MSKLLKKLFTSSTQRRIKNINRNVDQLCYSNISSLYMQSLLKENSLTSNALHSNSTGLNTSENRDKKIIVSLTSYSYRVKSVYLTIESILNQTIQPDEVILWLAEDEYNIDTIPAILKRQISRGLQVKFCKDIRSYKKIIPSLELYPNDIIITIDDDIMYPIDFIEGLYSAYLQNPEYIYCYRARTLPEDKSKLFDYNYWEVSEDNTASTNIVPIGIGGVLYTADKFDKNVLDEKCFMDIAPQADDIWLKAMSLKNNIKCQLLTSPIPFNNRFLEIPHSQYKSLWSSNQTKNNPQIEAVFTKFNLK